MENTKNTVLSFEFFPPKSLSNSQQLQEAAVDLHGLSPDFFSVTFGAGGSTQEGTLEMVRLLQQKTTTPVTPHISCMGLNRIRIIDLLDTYLLMGVKRLVVLRGDLPSGMGSIGEFQYASELVALIREIYDDVFQIEVAAYPECHPQAKSAHSDLLNLKKKYEAGASGAITQYFFNADAYFYFVEACAKEQIHLPIVPGIMPILHFNRLLRFSENCGAEIPRWLCKRLAAYGEDEESLRAFGLEVVYQLCERLLAGGAPGLHFYTLNQSALCLSLANQLGLTYSTPQQHYAQER